MPRPKNLQKNRTRGALTTKQEVFAYEYLKDFDAARAARAAGTAPSQAASVGKQWLDANRFPDLNILIKGELDARREACQAEAQRVVEELCRIAFMDPRRMFTCEGVMLRVQDLPADVAACVSEFETWTKYTKDPDTGETIATPVLKVRFHSKMAALQELPKHIGFLTGQNLDAGATVRDIFDRLMSCAAKDPEDVVEGRLEKLIELGPITEEEKAALPDEVVESPIDDVEELDDGEV